MEGRGEKNPPGTKNIFQRLRGAHSRNWQRMRTGETMLSCGWGAWCGMTQVGQAGRGETEMQQKATVEIKK